MGQRWRKEVRQMPDVSAWLTPEYVAMIAVIAVVLKWAVVPFIKDVLMSTSQDKGYTPLIIAFVAALILAFLYKYLKGIGTWDSRGVIMTVLVAIFAAASAIGLNVTTQAIRGKDVSITDG
jgi:predicted PurR-regulated permease PerM